MKKVLEPNYQMLFDSTVLALQNTYKQYKDAVAESLEWSFIDNNGNFCILAGYEERNARVIDQSKCIKCRSCVMACPFKAIS